MAQQQNREGRGKKSSELENIALAITQSEQQRKQSKKQKEQTENKKMT